MLQQGEREGNPIYYSSTLQQCSAFPLFSAKPYQRVQLCKFSVMCAKTSSSFSSVCLKVACNFANYVEMHAFTSRKQQHFKLLWFALIRPTFAKRTDSPSQWSAILNGQYDIMYVVLIWFSKIYIFHILIFFLAQCDHTKHCKPILF